MATQSQIQTALNDFNDITSRVDSNNRYTGDQFIARIRSILMLIMSQEDAQTLIDTSIANLNLSQYQTQMEVADAIQTAIAGIRSGTDETEVNRLINEALADYVETTELKPYTFATGRLIQATDIEAGVIPTGFAHTSWRGRFQIGGSYERDDVAHWGTNLFIARGTIANAQFPPEQEPNNWEVLGPWKGNYHAQYTYQPGDFVTNNSIVYLLVANSATTGVTPTDSNPLVWRRITGYTEAEIKGFAGEKINTELADGGSIKNAIDDSVPDTSEFATEEYVNDRVASNRVNLGNFPRHAEDADEFFENTYSHQHIETLSYTPAPGVTNYGSYFGDPNSHSTTNEDGLIANGTGQAT